MSQIITFTCVCGADKPGDAKYYDGAVGYEAVVCRKCGRMYDHLGEHAADEFSCHFVGITQEQAAEKAAFVIEAVRNYPKILKAIDDRTQQLGYDKGNYSWLWPEMLTAIQKL